MKKEYRGKLNTISMYNIGSVVKKGKYVDCNSKGCLLSSVKVSPSVVPSSRR